MRYDECASGRSIREYVWLGSTPIAMFTPDPANAASPPLIFYVHADHLDTPRVVVDKNNNLRWRWMAEPFGTTAPENNPSGLGSFTQNLRFPGQYADSESGLIYNYFRTYDTSTGRYTTPDPLGLGGGDMSLHAYAGGNPVSFVDPTGEFGVLGAVGGAAINAGGQAWALHKFGGATLEEAARCVDLNKVIISAGFGLVGPTFLNGVFRAAPWSFVAGTQISGLAVKGTLPMQPYTPFGSSAECDCLRAKARENMPALVRQLWDNLGI